jgi:YebC/PmpR family DNA-binding regulatory protein
VSFAGVGRGRGGSESAINAGVTMSGHSKWSTIKHKKAKEDNKRGKVFTKLIREITVAAREGGGDPTRNARLRLILDKAKSENMPSDNVSRAIKKGTGELAGGAAYEAFTYEGYGPHGIAVMIEVLTDNKNRTVSDLRHQFTRFGGALSEGGAVAWMFEHKGVIRATGTISEDELLEKLLDYNIDDVCLDDGIFSITCKMQDLDKIKKAVEQCALKVESAQLEWVAKEPISLFDKSKEEVVYKFLEALDDLDDTQNVFANLGD